MGEYKNNHKEGPGKAVNKNGTIAYDGTFVNNIPHGKGKVQSKDGKINEREWIEGIDKSYLENWWIWIKFNVKPINWAKSENRGGVVGKMEN